MNSSIRIEMRFKNALLYNLIHEQFNQFGQGCFLAASSAIGVGYGTLLALVSLAINPFCTDRARNPEKVGSLKPTAEKITRFFGLDAETLFPADLYRMNFPRLLAKEVDASHLLSASSREVLQLASAEDPAKNIERDELHAGIREVLDSLSPREQKVVELRFGIGYEREHSLEEVGYECGVGPERVRQIENKALRQLRSPSRAIKLRGFLERQEPERIHDLADTQKFYSEVEQSRINEELRVQQLAEKYGLDISANSANKNRVLVELFFIEHGPATDQQMYEFLHSYMGAATMGACRRELVKLGLVDFIGRTEDTKKYVWKHA